MILALRDTGALLTLRWQTIRSRTTRITLVAGILAVAGAILLMSYTGTMIRIVAQNSSSANPTIKAFARNYLESYLRGEFSSLVATALGIALISVIVAPFTGNSSTSLFPYHHLVSVRANERHRFTDSLVAQFFSSVTLLQLLALTALGSLLTIDSGRIEGILYAWASWPVLIAVSTLFVWLAEYLYRRFGEQKRLALFGIFLGLLGLAILFDPNHGTTIFGIGAGYAEIIQHFGQFSLEAKALSYLILALLFVGFIWGSYQLSRHTLALPEREKKQKESVKKRFWKTSQFPTIEVIHLLFTQLWRSPEIKKPLIFATVIGTIVIFLNGTEFSATTTMIFIIPLIVCLSWGANVFGVLGAGFVWLSSHPSVNRFILWIVFALQIVVIFGLFAVMCMPAIFFGSRSPGAFGGLLLALLSSATLMSRSAIYKSTHKPYTYRAGSRGETILPPATLINYTLRFSLWSGFYGIIVILANDILIQLALTLLAIAWSLTRMAILNKRWTSNPQLRNHVIFTVSSQ